MPVIKRFLTGSLVMGVLLGGAARSGTGAETGLAPERRSPLLVAPDAAYAPGLDVRGRAVAPPDLPAARPTSPTNGFEIVIPVRPPGGPSPVWLELSP